MLRINLPPIIRKTPNESPFEQYGMRVQPGASGNMAYREGVNDAGAAPLVLPPPVIATPVPEIPVGPPSPIPIPPQTGFNAAFAQAMPKSEDVLRAPVLPPPIIDDGAAGSVPPEVQKLINPYLPPPELRDHSTDKKRGFWANLGHRLEHIGKGALLGAAKGGLGGMIFGGIAGGVKPESADRLEHNLVALPEWERRNKIASEEADATLQRAGQYGQITGINPLSGMPTLPARKMEEGLEIQQQKLQQAYDALALREKLGEGTLQLRQEKQKVEGELAELKKEIERAKVEIGKQNANTNQQRTINNLELGKERIDVSRMTLKERARHNGVTEAQQRANEQGRNQRFTEGQNRQDMRQDKTLKSRKNKLSAFGLGESEAQEETYPTGHRKNQEITIKGKRHKVTGFNPTTGKLQVEPIE